MRIIQLLLGAFLWYVGTWTSTQAPIFLDLSNIFYTDYLVPSKPWISFVLYLLIFSIEVINYFVNRSNAKSTVKKILDNIVKTRFGSEYDSTRITVFRIRWGLSCIFSKLKSDLIAGITGKNHIQHRPFPHPFRQYLWIYARVGQPNERDSQACFLVPTSKGEIDGAGSKAVYSRQTVYVCVDSLGKEEVKEYERVDQIRTRALKSKVTKIIKESHLQSLKSLKSLNRFSTEIWVSPIIRKNQVWGIVAFDYDGKVPQLKPREQELVYDTKTIDNLLG